MDVSNLSDRELKKALSNIQNEITRRAAKAQLINEIELLIRAKKITLSELYESIRNDASIARKQKKNNKS